MTEHIVDAEEFRLAMLRGDVVGMHGRETYVTVAMFSASADLDGARGCQQLACTDS